MLIQQREQILYSESDALVWANDMNELGFNVMLEQVNMLAWRVVSWVVL